MYPVYSMAKSEVITNMCLNYITVSFSLFLCEVEQRISRTFVMSNDCIATYIMTTWYAYHT